MLLRSRSRYTVSAVASVAVHRMATTTAATAAAADEQFKVVLVGDSGVGKSSLLLRFTDDHFEELPATVGVDFRVKSLRVAGDRRRVKLTCWDTAGQERFRTLTGSYYRGAHGIILVYAVNSRESFENLQRVWLREVQQYLPREAAVKMVVGNKADVDERCVTREEGRAFAKAQATLFVEASAKTSDGVRQCFEELVEQILHTPALCASSPGAAAGGGAGDDVRIGQEGESDGGASCAC